MAFCENCGKTLAEGEVCNCTVPEKKGKLGLIFMIVLALVIVVLAVVLIIALASGSDSEESDEKGEGKKAEVKSTYMDPVNDFIKLVNKREVDALALKNAFIPDFATKKYNKIMGYFEKSDVFQEELEWENESLEDIYEECEEEFGDWKISFEEKSAQKIEDNNLKEYSTYVEDYYEDYMEDFQDELEDMLEDDDDIEYYADVWELSEEQTHKIFDSGLTLTPCNAVFKGGNLAEFSTLGKNNHTACLFCFDGILSYFFLSYNICTGKKSCSHKAENKESCSGDKNIFDIYLFHAFASSFFSFFSFTKPKGTGVVIFSI